MRTPSAETQRGHTDEEFLASWVDLVQCPPVAALTTLSRNGYPQTSVVWCDYDGCFVCVNTMRGFAKERNMRRDPRVTLLCYDPRPGSPDVEIRGAVVELTEDGARQHLDAIASRYAGRPVRYFGDVIPALFAETEIPVLCRIAPIQVVIGRGPDLPITSSGSPGRPATPDGKVAECPVPASHVHLLSGASCGVLTTLAGSGSPRSSLVSVAYEGDTVWVGTPRGADQGRSLPVDTRASLLVVDPDTTSRYVQIRGDLECASDEARRSWRIRPRRVICDAIHT
jgi:PPOX class probable F420-dependent enzyme